MTFLVFHDPGFLLALLAIPVLLMLNRRRRSAAIEFSSVNILRAVQSVSGHPVRVLPNLLRAAALALLVIALARPQEGRKSVEILTAGVDILLALDTSGSMRAMDFMRGEERITRLDVVKEVVRDFILKREHDRIGMVVFGSEAFTQAPLTLDHNLLVNFLDNLHIGMAGDSTAIGSAVGIAAKRLKDLRAKSKIIVLLTDGSNNAGNLSPRQAAEIARALGIKIYTIGVGTRGQAPFPVDTVFGRSFIYREADLDEATLRHMADETGGQYFRATDRQTLKDIYARIDRLEKSEVKRKEHAEYNELFPNFLYAALALLLTEALLANTLLLRIP